MGASQQAKEREREMAAEEEDKEAKRKIMENVKGRRILEGVNAVKRKREREDVYVLVRYCFQINERK